MSTFPTVEINHPTAMVKVVHTVLGWPELLRLRSGPEELTRETLEADAIRLLERGLLASGGVALGARFVIDGDEPHVVTTSCSSLMLAPLTADAVCGTPGGVSLPLSEAARATGLLMHFVLPLDGGGCLSFFDSVASELAAGPPVAVAPLRSVAEHLSVLIANAATLAASRATITQLREAMLSRSIIEQAKGVLMARERIDAETAWEYMVRISQRSHRKLRDICSDIVQKASTGTLS